MEVEPDQAIVGSVLLMDAFEERHSLEVSQPTNYLEDVQDWIQQVQEQGQMIEREGEEEEKEDIFFEEKENRLIELERGDEETTQDEQRIAEERRILEAAEEAEEDARLLAEKAGLEQEQGEHAHFEFVNEIQPLSPDTAEAVIGDRRRFTVLLFTEFTDDCYFCHLIEQTLLRVGARLLELRAAPPHLLLAKFDCFRHPSFCEQHQASVYPLVKFFAYGIESTLAAAPDDFEATLRFIQSSSAPKFDTLSVPELALMLTTHRTLVLGFFSPADLSFASPDSHLSNSAESFSRFATATHGEAPFVVIDPLLFLKGPQVEENEASDSSSVVDLRSLLTKHATPGGILALRAAEDSYEAIPFSGKASLYGLRRWLRLASESPVISSSSFHGPFLRSPPAVHLWCDDSSPLPCPAGYTSLLEAASRRLPASLNINFTWLVLPSHTFPSSYANTNASDPSSSPSSPPFPLLLMTHFKDNRLCLYRFHQDSPLTPASVAWFVTNYRSHRFRNATVSFPSPFPPLSSIQPLSSHSQLSLSTIPTFLFLYSPHSTHPASAALVALETVASSISPSLASFFHLDDPLSSPLACSLSITSFPALVVLPIHPSSSPTLYSGDFSPSSSSSLSSWIHSFLSSTSSDPVPSIDDVHIF